jgi:hypothetical protein
MNIITARKTHGYRVETDISGKVISEADLRQCPHCGTHFTIVKGSGIQRMWCGKCHAVCCGSPECIECIPIEAKFEAIELAAAKQLRGY